MNIFIVTWKDALGQNNREIHRSRDSAVELKNILEQSELSPARGAEPPKIRSYSLPDEIEQAFELVAIAFTDIKNLEVKHEKE